MEHGSVHISPNTVQGSLQDAPITRLLDSCRKNLVTGRIEVDSASRTGWIELRAGVVEDAGYGHLTGGKAIAWMRQLGDGNYEISQRLPDLSGQLGSAAAFCGELHDVSLVQIMRHCEDNALTCRIVIVHEFDRGVIEYRGGDISQVMFNGVTDEDRIVDMVRLDDARFLVSAPPLDIGVQGWPVVRRDPTEPFRIEHLASRPPPRPQTKPFPPPVDRTPGLPDVQQSTTPPAAQIAVEPPVADPVEEELPGQEIADEEFLPQFAEEDSGAMLAPDDVAPIALAATSKMQTGRKKGEPRDEPKPRAPRPAPRRGLRGRLGALLRRASVKLGDIAERLTPASPAASKREAPAPDAADADEAPTARSSTSRPAPEPERRVGGFRRLLRRWFGRRRE